MATENEVTITYGQRVAIVECPSNRRAFEYHTNLLPWLSTRIESIQVNILGSVVMIRFPSGVNTEAFRRDLTNPALKMGLAVR